LETRRNVVDPPTRSLAAPAEGGEPPAKASGNQLLRRSHDAARAEFRSGVQGHRLDEENPVRTPGKIDKPL